MRSTKKTTDLAENDAMQRDNALDALIERSNGSRRSLQGRSVRVLGEGVRSGVGVAPSSNLISAWKKVSGAYTAKASSLLACYYLCASNLNSFCESRVDGIRFHTAFVCAQASSPSSIQDPHICLKMRFSNLLAAESNNNTHSYHLSDPLP